MHAILLTGLAMLMAGSESPAGVDLLAPGIVPGQVVVLRDEWGVPHIYAETLAGAAYGMGYAQAEDRLADMLMNVRIATGRASEVLGPDALEQDYFMRLFRNDSLPRESWSGLPEPLRAIGDGFAAGVNAWMREHPDGLPDGAFPFEGWHCVAIGRAMILRWPIGTLQDKLKKQRKDPGIGSNTWIVGASRSAEGCPILLADPHLTWEGLAVFYEARIHTLEHDLCGFALAGSPLLAMGHNAYLAWACTTGGPDTADVYEMELDSANPGCYLYDGQSRGMEKEEFVFNVKGGGAITKDAFYTHLGPVLPNPGAPEGKVFAGATPYFNHTRLFEQMIRMNTAQNCAVFREALAINQFMAQNITFADVHGDFGYVRVGDTPRRPDGYDWTMPVPGNTSATAWKGMYAFDELVQIMNPPQGYLQNCNTSPQYMMPDSPMTPDKYPSAIYNVSWDGQNNRGRRALEMLAASSSVTREQAMAITFDCLDLDAPAWRDVLSAAWDASSRPETFAEPVRAALAWDGQFLPESRGAALCVRWRLACQEVGYGLKELSASPELREKAMTVFGETVTAMVEQFKTWDLAWGEYHKVGRGGKLFPAAGANYGDARSLLTVRGKPGPDGVCVANNGSMSMMLAFLKPGGVESYTCMSWGQSGHLESSHYVDQAEKLYAKRQMKPTWFAAGALAGHVDSRVVLVAPPGGAG